MSPSTSGPRLLSPLSHQTPTLLQAPTFPQAHAHPDADRMAMAASVLLLLILVRQSVGQVSSSPSSSSNSSNTNTTTTTPHPTSPYSTHTTRRIPVDSTATQDDLLLLSTASPLPTNLYPLTDTGSCYIHLYRNEMNDTPSDVARLPATVSVSSILTVSVAINISFVFVDATGRPLACIVFNPSRWKTSVYQYLGYCGHGEAVHQLRWISWIRNKYLGWPKSLRSYDGYGYFHMQAEVTSHSFHEKTVSTIAVKPNGQQKDSLSMTVEGVPQFLYVFGNVIELGVNLLSFHNGCTASKCMKVEEIFWNDTIYFLPDEVASETVIYITCCQLTERITYRTNDSEHLWHSLTLGENSVSEVDYFRRPVFVDGEEVGELRITNDHVSEKVAWCLPYEGEIVIEGAIWTMGCDPTNGAAGHPNNKSYAPKVIGVITMVQLLLSTLMTLT